jgi:hypothetical protein
VTENPSRFFERKNCSKNSRFFEQFFRLKKKIFRHLIALESAYSFLSELAEANAGQRDCPEPSHRSLQIEREGDAPRIQVSFKFWDRCYDFENIFAKKFSEKIGVSDTNQSQILKKLIITLVFEKNAIFFAENWQKSQKILIITSTPV